MIGSQEKDSRDITFLSQPNRFVFLVGSEIQPSSLESKREEEDVRMKTKEKELLDMRAAFNHGNHFKEHLDILKLRWHLNRQASLAEETIPHSNQSDENVSREGK